jgi:Pirin
MIIQLFNNSHIYNCIVEPNPAWFGNGPNDSANPSWTNKNWLKSRFHFSFAEYNNEDNTNFGVLRVLNDDLVQPRREFGEHPHRDVEICTYVVEGFLSHKDSMGTEETLGRGAVQFMVNTFKYCLSLSIRFHDIFFPNKYFQFTAIHCM